MKKILIISFIPYPLTAGGFVAQFAVLESLQHVMDITFCGAIFNKDSEQLIIPLQKLLPKVKFITAFNGGIKKKKTSNQKLLGIVKSLAKFGNSIKKETYFSNSNDDFYNPKTSQPFDYKTEGFLNEISELCKKEKFDFIQTEFHPFLELINVFPNQSKKIFVAHESRYLRLKSSYHDSKASTIYKNFILERNRINEVALLAKYNAVITFSDFDKSSLEQEGLKNIHSIPFPIIDTEFLPTKKYGKPNKVVFIGNEGHTPNKEGFIWYLKKCHNQIYQQFQLPLVVIGNWSMKEEVLREYSNVSFVGTVESIDPYYENAILVVPIFSGSGIRTKILYGMAKKVPIISSELGCQGLHVTHQKELFIANDALNTIASIKFILDNDLIVESIVQNAYQFVEQSYNQNAILNKRMELYNNL